MSDRQHPIGSGFDKRSTAEDVLAGIDLGGKVALVTGGYSGLGLETVKALSRAGASIIVPARRPEVARRALAGVTNVDILPMDLADLDSVRSAAQEIAMTGRRIHMAILDAGIMACPETRVGPGWEAQFAVNHLGHYVLINRIWSAFSDAARVVSVSSGGHGITGMRWNDIHFETGYDKWQAYGQSKTANVLFAVKLDELGRDAGIRSYSLHPGAILTPLQRHLGKEEMVAAGWIDTDGNLADSTFKTPEQGAATQVWAATNPRLNVIGGVYCEDCDIAPVSRADGEPGVKPHAIDTEEATRLWAYSAKLTEENALG
ncbi:SDR family NAD(P)-dependent oxidoreductase [Devosia sp. XK-2]|uniref:SDR family NAD(P)-dependent oxidoreductase n=1 Tax=Devosia sp. XK-2 TaxID=3126689 RepID=UPI0030D350B3